MKLKSFSILILFSALICQVLVKPTSYSVSSLSSSQAATLTYSSSYYSYSNFGNAIDSIGDVNGDLISDFIIGIQGDNKVAIVYGVKGGLPNFDVSIITQAQGFIISGESTGDYFGSSVAGLGDVNGDGKADFAIGASGHNSGKGAVYVIYGTGAKRSNFSVTSLSYTVGYKIYATSTTFNNAKIGTSVSRVGDFDKDGIMDILISAPNYNYYDGRAWVIFGLTGTSRTILDLDTLTNYNGFSIVTGSYSYSQVGDSIAAAGDLNGDGRADVIVGAPGDYAAYVIYGKATRLTTSLSVTSLASTDGLTIQDSSYTIKLGSIVAGGGDVNSDGKIDLIVGGYNSAYQSVIFVYFKGYNGTSMDFSNALNSSEGFNISSSGYSDLGSSINMKGDVTGDGIDDIILGAPMQDSYDGAVFVVKGRKSGFTNITADTQADIEFTTSNYYGALGTGLTATGDFNNDGVYDLIIGEPSSYTYKGKAYVVYGGSGSLLGNGSSSKTKLKLSTGAIIGIAVGGAALVLVIITCTVIAKKNRYRAKLNQTQANQNEYNSRSAPAPVLSSNLTAFETKIQPQTQPPMYEYNMVQSPDNTTYSPSNPDPSQQQMYMNQNAAYSGQYFNQGYPMQQQNFSQQGYFQQY